MLFLPRVTSPGDRLFLLTLRGRLAAGEGKGPEAAKELRAVIAAAGESGFVGQELFARSALVSVLMGAGDVAAARSELADLEKEAGVGGYALFTRKAEALRKDLPHPLRVATPG